MLQSIKDTLIQICVITPFYQNVRLVKAAFVSLLFTSTSLDVPFIVSFHAG